MKNILKIGFVAALLILALSVTGFAASITSVEGTDGTNAFATSADALTADTALESTLTVSGTVDVADANVTIMISAEGTIVYVNQTVADENGAFEFEFPVTLENGYVYEVKVNTENSENASKLYFKTASAASINYGDVDGSGVLETLDAVYIARAANKMSVPASVTDADTLGDVDGNGVLETLDAVYVARAANKMSVIDVAAERMAWAAAQ